MHTTTHGEVSHRLYAQNNDRKTFMLLFEKDFPNMAAARYEQNEDFFVKMFSDPDWERMRQVMEWWARCCMRG